MPVVEVNSAWRVISTPRSQVNERRIGAGSWANASAPLREAHPCGGSPAPSGSLLKIKNPGGRKNGRPTASRISHVRNPYRWEK
jgi:hypothetical protein